MTNPARQTFKEPDVTNRCRQRNVAKTLPAYFRLRNFDTTLVADYAPVLHPLVLPAEALPIYDRSKNFRAEQAVAFRFERTVVNRLWLLHLTMRPRKYSLGRGKTNSDFVKICS